MSAKIFHKHKICSIVFCVMYFDSTVVIIIVIASVSRAFRLYEPGPRREIGAAPEPFDANGSGAALN